MVDKIRNSVHWKPSFYTLRYSLSVEYGTALHRCCCLTVTSLSFDMLYITTCYWIPSSMPVIACYKMPSYIQSITTLYPWSKLLLQQSTYDLSPLIAFKRRIIRHHYTDFEVKRNLLLFLLHFYTSFSFFICSLHFYS